MARFRSTTWLALAWLLVAPGETTPIHNLIVELKDLPK
jgi:hypothetical protein